MALPPLLLISETLEFPNCSFRPMMTTLACCSAIAFTNAPPKIPVPPLTMITLSFNENSSSFL